MLSPLRNKKVITISLLTFLAAISGFAIYTVNNINKNNNVNPQSSQAFNDAVQESWTLSQKFPMGYGTHGSLAVVNGKLVALAVANDGDSRERKSYISVYDQNKWGSPIMLGDYGELRGGIAEWEGQLIAGQYPNSGMMTFNLDGTYVENKSNLVAWGQSVWKTSYAGSVYKPASDNPRFYYSRNILTGNGEKDYSQLSFLKNWTGSGKGNVDGYHVTRLNIKESPSEWGPMEVIGNKLYAAENIFKKGGNLYMLGPLPDDWQSSEKVLPETRLRNNIPNATITDLKASADGKILYVTGFDQTRGGANYEGLVYAVDTTTNSLVGNIVRFPVPSTVSSVTIHNDKLILSLGRFNDDATRNTGLVECTLTATKAVNTCTGIYRPNDADTITSVAVYNEQVFAIAKSKTGEAIVYKRNSPITAVPSNTTTIPTATPTPSVASSITPRPTSTTTPVPSTTAGNPMLCDSITLSTATLEKGKTLSVVAKATTTVKNFILYFYNLDNLQGGQPKPIQFTQNRNYTMLKTVPTEIATSTFTLNYTDFDRMDTSKGAKPKNIQVSAVFMNGQGKSDTTTKCTGVFKVQETLNVGE